MFVYSIPLIVNLTMNSNLEKFGHKMNTLWKLSGSSLGALRELVAVAGILIFADSATCSFSAFSNSFNNNAFEDPLATCSR
jgi:hypothetical protein